MNGTVVPTSCSFQSVDKSIAHLVSEELWHSLDLDQVVVVHIEVSPGALEVISQEGLRAGGIELEMGLDDFHGGIVSCVLVEEEVARWGTILVLHLKSVVLDEGSHEGVVSLLGESGWNRSLVSALGTHTVEVWKVVLELEGLNHNIRSVIELIVSLSELEKSPVIMEMAGEGAIWVSISWNWSTDVWLWVLLKLGQSPVIVQVG